MVKLRAELVQCPKRRGIVRNRKNQRGSVSKVQFLSIVARLGKMGKAEVGTIGFERTRTQMAAAPDRNPLRRPPRPERPTWCAHCAGVRHRRAKAMSLGCALVLSLRNVAGDVLGLSRPMAYRNWKYARAWLRDGLEK